MISAIMGFVLKHWKVAGLVVVFVAVGAWGLWQRHEANTARARAAQVRTMLAHRVAADRLAVQRAKDAQAAADAAQARQKAALAALASSATHALSEAEAALRRSQKATVDTLGKTYHNSVSARAWRDTPIPASIRAAIEGTGP